MQEDRLDGTVNYAEAYEIVRREMTQSSALLEHVGGRIAHALFAAFPVLLRIEVEVCKDLIEKPTAIESVGSADNAVEVARYNAAGQRINGKQKGLNIVKLSNGTTLKVVVK